MGRAGLETAMQAVGLMSIKNSMDSEQRWGERDTAAAHNKLWGESYKPTEVEGEEMHVGDDNSQRNYYYPEQPKPSVLGTLAKFAVGAGLMMTGVGAPAAGYFIWDALKNPPAPKAAPNPVPVKNTDTDTQYEFFLDPPEQTK